MLSILRNNATSQRPQPLRHLPSYSTMMTTQKLLLSASSSTTTKAAQGGWQRSLSILPSMNTLIRPNNLTNSNNLSSTNLPESSHRLYSTGGNVWNTKSSINNHITTTKRHFSSQPPPGNLGNIFQHAQNSNQNSKKPGQTLEQYGVDLTAMAKDG